MCGKESTVADTIGQMPRTDFIRRIEAVVEQKLVEILGDPDAGMDLQEPIREQLLRQQQAIQAGERGQPLEDVLQQLGLE